MNTFSENQLRDIMLSTAGETGDTADLPADFLDMSFTELGFDSLAVLEIATRIQQDSRLSVPDEAVEEMKKPRNVLNYVNQMLAAV